MIALVLGGLFVTGVFLYPAVQLKKRRKWWPLMGGLMLLAGIGLVGIAVWIANLASNAGLWPTLVVGGIALILLGGFFIATAADVSDGKLDYPWNVFALPPLLAIVLVTGATTVGFVTEQVQKNADTLTSQVSAR